VQTPEPGSGQRDEWGVSPIILSWTDWVRIGQLSPTDARINDSTALAWVIEKQEAHVMNRMNKESESQRTVRS
jgi:hypothetical protein